MHEHRDDVNGLSNFFFFFKEYLTETSSNKIRSDFQSCQQYCLVRINWMLAPRSISVWKWMDGTVNSTDDIWPFTQAQYTCWTARIKLRVEVRDSFRFGFVDSPMREDGFYGRRLKWHYGSTKVVIERLQGDLGYIFTPAACTGRGDGYTTT